MNSQATVQRHSSHARKLFFVISTLAFAFILSMLLSESASAHGYMESPASRGYMCKEKLNTGCGSIQYEPQSSEAVGNFPQEGPKDGEIAGAGGFTEMNAQSATRWNKVTMNGGKNTFTWKLTANHASAYWSYYITKKDWDPNKPITRDSLEAEPFCFVDYKGAKPPTSVSHDCEVPTDRSGYHVILGVWEISDTINAFYNVIDVNLVNDVSAPQAPSAPSNVAATATTIDSITLGWQASTSANSIKQYDVYRDGALLGSTAVASFKDEKLKSDTAYTYTIKAIDQNGLASVFSTPLVAKTLKDGNNGGGENGGSTLPEWDAKTVYVKGNKVQYKGLEYEAQWWTQNNAPDSNSAWKLVSPSNGGGTGGTGGTAPAAWNSGSAYVGGDRVVYNGVEYIAKWWTMGNTPDQSDVWKKA